MGVLATGSVHARPFSPAPNDKSRMFLHQVWVGGTCFELSTFRFFGILLFYTIVTRDAVSNAMSNAMSNVESMFCEMSYQVACHYGCVESDFVVYTLS